MDKFSKKKNRLLIELVKKNPILYDPNDPNFKNCFKKLKAWENISSIMNIPVTDLKRRWKHFRDHFHKKQKAETAGLATSHTWAYKPQLQFLAECSNYNYKDKVKNNKEDTKEIDEGLDYKTELDVSVEKETAEDSSSEDSDNEGVFQDSKEDSGDVFDINERDEIREAKPGQDPLGLIHYEVQSEAVQEGVPKKKRKKMGTLAAVLEKRLAKRFSFETSKSDISPTHKFFESMADIVAQFPPQLVAETRLKICQLVNEMEMKNLREQEFLDGSLGF